jgi:photosystem II stability/assembly factor-like uncharacterized protein
VDAASNASASSIRQSLLGSLDWRLIGPHRGGRVVAVAGDVSDPATFYFGACAGGVWKTDDGGTSWHNVSDGFFSTAAVGAIAVSESDPNVVYAGTGEACIRNDASHGDGVYRSTDGGRTWRNVGLRDTRHIGKIQIHPRDPDTVYVAALGHAYGPNEERGVFRTRDGGRSWERILYKSPRAGSHDVSLDPNNPRILFAAIWQVQRYPHTLVSGGEECGLWRSTDGGDTWEEVSRNPGLPTGLLGKIGVAVSPARSGRVWAVVEADDGGVFRSDDGGESWIRLSEQSLLRTRPWYYMHITADPTDPDTVWAQNYSLWKSIDGGASFNRIPTPHGDDHALWIDPRNSRRMIEGNDGGACVSYNGGRSWSSIYNQPTAQLYHVTTDNQVPYRIYGSQQDNSAISIPSRTVDGAIHERDWYAPGGGESGYISIKPDDPNIVVGSGPAGRRAFNDVMTVYDRRTHQARNITVWPELHGWGVGSEGLKERFQWTFPIQFSLHDPNVLYVAGNRLFRSTDLGSSWEAISDDLTRNDPTRMATSGGPITRDNTGAEVYCTIFALAESPLRAGLLWAGTDDGLVHLSEDGGSTWRNVTPPDLPEWALISIVEASPHAPGTAYVAATRYKLDDTRPYLYKTTDFGQSWTQIAAGIPSDEFTRVIRADPSRPGLLYAGTETGLYASLDDGASWSRLGGNLPVVPIYDLTIKGVEMVVATHGRSFWILDDLTPLHQLVDGIADGPVHLFQPRPTVRMRGLGRSGRDPVSGQTNYARVDTTTVSYLPARQSDGSVVTRLLDAGANSPAGVVIQYYLAAEPSGGMTLTVLDQDGHEVRSFGSGPDGLPARLGMNRIVWSMRRPGAPRLESPGLDPWQRTDGPLVMPGTYQVRLMVGDQTQTQSFEIEPDPRIQTRTDDIQAQHDVLLEILAKLTRTGETVTRVDALVDQIEHWEHRVSGRDEAGAVHAMAAELKQQLGEVRGQLIDVHMSEAQLWPSGLHEKLNALFDAIDSADYAPPRQTRDVYAALSAQLDTLTARLDALARDRLPGLNNEIRAAGLQPIDVTT